MNQGWYQDPSSQNPQWRYWDGNQWTEHTAPMYEQTQPGPPAQVTDPAAAQNSGGMLFVRRLGAYLVDSVLVNAVATPIWLVVMWFLSQSPNPATIPEKLAFYGKVSTISLVILAIVYFVYERFFITKNAATPGMQLLSLKVDPANGATLGSTATRRGIFFAVLSLSMIPPMLVMGQLVNAAGRPVAAGFATFVLSWLPGMIISTLFLIGCFAVLWNSNQRAWHDHLTKAHIRANLALDGQLVKADSHTKVNIWMGVAVGIVAILTMNQVMNHYVGSTFEDILIENIGPYPH